jgi:hypothetical protein
MTPPMPETLDYVDLALQKSRAEFVAACNHPFLVGAVALVRPRGPQPTVCAEYPEISSFLAGGPAPTQVVRMERPVVLPVRKITKAFPSMITIGRTSNHDLVLTDVEISKFHAFLRPVDDGFELVDAGSSNGTWVGKRRLHKREAQTLQYGDVLHFGRLRFHFFDAGGCSDVIREMLR